MAAISNTLFTFLSPGDRIVSIKDSYGGTTKLFTEFLPRFQIEVTLCDTTDHRAIEKAVAEGCRMLYLESPTNPTLKVVDIAGLTQKAHETGAMVVVDNTFATPILQNPLKLGADLVLHSATKFLGGHADALGGVVCGPSDLIAQIYHFREINGAALRHLEAHEKIEQVFYPGLESHPQHKTAKTQMTAFGGILSFSIKGGFEAVCKVLPQLNYAHRAANLGAVETIAGPPATTSHVECTAEERAAMGIPENLVRYSVGIEDADDLIADLDQALGGI
jgi:cystathionine gamma-synthase